FYSDEDYTREIPRMDAVEENSDVWDDSALVAAWDSAVKEYQSFHSIRATKSANKKDTIASEVENSKIGEHGEESLIRPRQSDNKIQGQILGFNEKLARDDRKITSESSSQTEKEPLEETIDNDASSSYQYHRSEASQSVPYGPYFNYYMPPPQHHYHSFPE
ncbi:11232_t:CDS:2, partial [Acaulospora morrowiae]